MAEDVDFSALRILVIDDQDFVRTIVAKMLGQIGVPTVLEAKDGASGFDVVKAERPDLVICDIQMRPMDGFGFVRMLREDPGAASTPVILLTAHTDAAGTARAKELGVNAILAKPVLPPALKERIAAVLRR
ncbi:response regulator [Magnetospirillum sp. UT-4]|uniref:response regulator n=1 Tax=Magnetospirillum sp. UT-4 TaxID=2681467 RepID=UPI00137E7924|nr:response regulator [Magnetospirillum sp. UT-4]CAA7622479.1 putative chemotaxis protein CheY [Magnetospirillum sp. UT-4]